MVSQQATSAPALLPCCDLAGELAETPDCFDGSSPTWPGALLGAGAQMIAGLGWLITFGQLPTPATTTSGSFRRSGGIWPSCVAEVWQQIR